MRRLAPLALVLAAACGKQTFIASAFVQTPAMPNPLDATKPIPGFQVLTAYLGTIDTSNPTKLDTSRIGTIDDAVAQVTFHHTPAPGAPAGDVAEDRVLPVTAEGSGQYALTSTADARLTFEETPYTLVFTVPGGESFGARMSPGVPADMTEFAYAECTNPITVSRCIETAAGTDLTITRTDAAAGPDRPPAFLLVGRIDPNNVNAEPQITYKTVPSDAVSLLEFVLSDAGYRWSQQTIPGAQAFPQPGIYVVTLLTATTGKVSNNAFFGSVAMAASGNAGVVHVQ